MEEILKPCPFCGGEARYKVWNSGRTGRAYGRVYCRNHYNTKGEDWCWLEFYTSCLTIDEVKNELFRTWNKRAEVSDQQGERNEGDFI